METGKQDEQAEDLKYIKLCTEHCIEIDRVLRKKTADGTKLFKYGTHEILRVEKYREDLDLREYHAFGFYIDVIDLEGEKGFRTPTKPIIKSMLIHYALDNKYGSKEGRWGVRTYYTSRTGRADYETSYTQDLSELMEKIKASKPLKI